MAERKRVTVPVRVHPDTRNDWHDFAERDDNEWESVSDLIRGAVYREMDGMYSSGPAGNVTADVDLGPVLDHIEQLNKNISDLDQRVASIGRHEDDRIGQLASEIRDLIPRVDDPAIIEELDPSGASMPTAELIGTYGSVDDIVNYLTDKHEDVNEMQARTAVDRLRDDLPASIETVTYTSEVGSDTRICEVR